jgi:hypothetical protein
MHSGDEVMAALQGYNAMGSSFGSFDLWKNGLRDILINRNTIAQILKENTAVKTSPFSILSYDFNEYFLSVETFFAKLFAIIKANSGGAIDLFLTVKESDSYTGVENSTLEIYNRKGPESKPSPFVFNKGMVAIKNISITSKVPSATAAAAFGSSAQQDTRDADAGKGAKLLNGEGTTPGTGYPSNAEVWDAKVNAALNYFDMASTDALRGILKRAVDNESPTKSAAKGPIMWPLELKLTILGTYGWRFGDTISYSDLPKKYRDDKGTVKIGFTVTRAQQSFGEIWTTDLTTQCRFVA